MNRSLRSHIRSVRSGFAEAIDALAAATGGLAHAQGAAEWLLDNDYVIVASLQHVEESLPRHFVRQLPVGTDGNPAIHAVAREYWAASGAFEPARLASFVEQHQADTPLTIGELWALPAFLRLVVAEDLLAAVREASRAPARQAGALDDRVGFCVTALRGLDAADWPAFVETVSLVNRVLALDPVGAYTAMEFATRDDYRKAVERLARRSALSEVEVAHRAVRLARSGATERARHVGTYLMAEGVAPLEQSLGIASSRPDRLKRTGRRWATGVYLGGIALLTLAALALPLAYVRALGAGGAAALLVLLVAAVPATGLAVAIANRVVTLVMHPRLLPKMDFRDGFAPGFRVAVVVPALLEEDELDSLLLAMEMSYLGNDDPLLSYVLLADPPDAAEQTTPQDSAVLDHAVRGVQTLNRRYGDPPAEHAAVSAGPFLLVVRGRTWNPVERIWMGWERKRGKLEEMNRLLTGQPGSTLVVAAGDPGRLEGVRAVITLDADTNMPAGAAARLAGTLAHPLNRPQFAEGTPYPKIAAGYTVIQPRVETTPASAGATMFARVYSGNTALDLYTHAVSDVYQDLFGEGVYTGKGIYDLEGFVRSLAGAVPENRILSHDLFEGLHGRVGLASDIVVYEDYPPGVLSYMRRMHRWVRGDWQLLGWLAPRVPAEVGSRPNTFWQIGRWKILDNLRRTLIPPSVLGLLVAGWTFLPGSPWLWTTLGLGVIASPVLLAPITAAQRIATGTRWAAAGHDVLLSMRDLAVRVLLDAALLPYEATVILDAVGRTLYRMAVSHRGLLEWTTASRTRSLLRLTGGAEVWREMAPAVAIAFAVMVLVALVRPAALVPALPFVIAWLVSPEIAVRVSRRAFEPADDLPAPAIRELRRVARKTWLYFERHAGPEGNWLAPDHYQEDPLDLVARRTSPTNIGLGLLASLTAHDRGYVTVMDLTLRLEGAMGALRRMETRWGHLFNWYDSRDLSPMEPRYISTVDSGNLAGALITLAEGLADVPDAPIHGASAREGLMDTLDVLREILRAGGPWTVGSGRHRIQWRIDSARRLLGAEPDSAEEWGKWLAQLEHAVIPYVELRALRLVESSPDEGMLDAAEVRLWLGRLRHEVTSARRNMEMYLPWAGLLADAPTLPAAATAAVRETRAIGAGVSSLRDIPAACIRMEAALERVALSVSGAGGPAEEWLASLSSALAASRRSATDVMVRLDRVAVLARAAADAMDFTVLFDSGRKLFRIGYNVTDDLPDPNHYDLLASEARLASFVAIAKGDVPERHWLHLGRPYGRIAGAAALMSWGATSFEYLMPRLIMYHPRGSLLEVSCRAAVAAHRSFASRAGIPWGISESAFHAFDVSGEYQYRSFGVPGLGLKRELGDRLVVAPYASFLALPFVPEEVVLNSRRLRQLGAEGSFGFYDAVDFGDPDAREHHPHLVRTYMSHHQGMLLLAVHNYLSDDVMVRRFHRVPQVLAAERLLWEQRPRRAPSVTALRGDKKAPPHALPVPVTPSWEVPVGSGVPQVQMLSAGETVALVGAGGGGSLISNGIAVRPAGYDPVVENLGSWIYLRDVDSGDVWSAAGEPVSSESSSASVRFSPSEATFHRAQNGIATHMTVAVVASPDAEIRRIRIANESESSRRLTVTNFAEIALDDPAAHARHPAFSRLFVVTEDLPEMGGILLRRRWREPDAARDPHVVHRIVAADGAGVRVRSGTDRARFLGRGRGADDPSGLVDRSWVGTFGSVLDPAVILETDVELEPASSVTLTFVTIVASSRAAAIRGAQRLDSPARIEHALDQTKRSVAADLQKLGLAGHELRVAQQLLSAALAGGFQHRAPRAALTSAHAGQRGLWPFGISGDLPIVLVKVSNPAHAVLAHLAVRIHGLWRGKDGGVDLVIADSTPDSYERPIQDRLAGVIEESGASSWLHKRGGVFVVQASRASPEEMNALEASARVVLDAAITNLEEELAPGLQFDPRLPAFVPVPSSAPPDPPTPPLARPDGLQFDNGRGGFTPDGREYVIWLEPGQSTPAPWIHVMANPEFGCLVSERGLGTTWSVNSAERRLTTWPNDPVTDPPSEVLYLRDEETGSIWSATPAPAGARTPYEVRYGAGRAVFKNASHGLDQELSVFVAPDAPVKFVQLRLRNLRNRPRRITATYYAEWVLGTRQGESSPHVMCGFHHDSEALMAHNRFRPEYAERVAFLVSSERAHGLTADRREFLGSHALVTAPSGPSGPAAWPVHIPDALLRIGLSGNIEPGVDPCAALQVHIDLGALETKTLHFALGDGANLDEARGLATESRPHAAAERAMQAGQEFWDTTLGRAQVTTPDPALDMMVNRWLPYQTLACRIWGRTALYQSSGAYGFRDQLQDVSSLLWLAPHLAREHLLRAAAHQFQEGDVLHWWHPPTDAGVRTKIADDLLWLPYAVARYVRWTGDRSVLEEAVPYLIGPEPKDASDLYARFDTAGEGTLLDHCLRALRRGATAGRTGLPLFASGDWNDGMNRVGEKGEGESVWLAWFLFAVLRDFADLIAHDDPDTARELRERAQALGAAAEASAWDGAWYLRGTFDDGTPLGSSRSVEARIDAIAQSWAVISGGAERGRAERAMESVREELLRREAGVLLLLAPPFTHSKPDPGYIGAYPPGVRENGGQYTHAAAWAAIAWALLGQTDLAHEVFGMLTPVRRTSTRSGSDLYRGEPYAVAADVYGVAPHMGRAGWTWYTGAAGWLYRLGLETILGLRLENGALVVEPRLPTGWDGFAATLEVGGEVVTIRVKPNGEWEAGSADGTG